MKSIIMPMAVQLDEEAKRQLTNEVKETLATVADFKNIQSKKSFTAAEMWYSRRNARSASSMMRRWA